MSDQFATSRAIDALQSTALQSVAETLVDRVTGIVGAHQVRVEEGQSELQKALADIRHQLAKSNEARAADTADRQQVTGFLERIVAQNQEALQRLGKVEQKTDVMNERIGALSGVLSDFQEATNEKIGDLDGRVSAVETEVASLRVEVKDLSHRVSAIEETTNATQAFLEAFPPIAEIQRLMDADRET